MKVVVTRRDAASSDIEASLFWQRENDLFQAIPN
jgi:hypothetical protein